MPAVRTDRPVHPPRRVPLRTIAAVLVVGLTASAWLAMIVWNASPQGRYLDHDGLTDATVGAYPQLGLFVGGWTLMLVAMMLPSTYPLLVIFERVIARRRDRALLLIGLTGGYLAIWMVVGYVAYLGDQIVHGLVESSGTGTVDASLVTAGALALAGAFQFSSLKERCLERCRSPRALVMTHWHGRRPAVEALRLGWRHGRSCVGCCWALMLVMLAVGHGNLGWMLLLAAVMTVEKVLPLGRRLARPTGVVLVAAAAMTALGT